MLLPVPLYIQYITFVMITFMRTFLHSTAGGLYVNVFHFAHLGKLTGLGSIASAIFCLMNDPLFKIVNNKFNEDPGVGKVSLDQALNFTPGPVKSIIFCQSA